MVKQPRRLPRRLEKDLERAARIQKELLPREDPHFGDFDISGRTHPCYEVGGDYYDYIPIDGNRLGVVVADVSGKGISAALLMASLRAALRSEVHPGYDMAKLFSRLNDFIYNSSPENAFITLFFAELTADSGLLRYINAGHNPPIFHQKDVLCCVLEGTGLPLGMLPGAKYETGSVSLNPGDSVMIFTDGVIEGRDKSGREFSMSRLKTLFQKSAQESSAGIIDRIAQEVKSHIVGSDQCDDLTLVVIKRKGVRPGGPVPGRGTGVQ